MNTIIIDDEANARDTLKELIQLHCPQVQIIGMAENVAKGLQLLKSLSPEVVFLDIEMPDGTGFDLLQKVENKDFKVIFTTAHDKYAIQAFKFAALDYLLKPINSMELKQAIVRAEESKEKEMATLKIQTLLQNLDQTSQNLKKIILKDRYGIQLIKVEEIIRLESGGSYTTFFLKDKNTIIASNSLKEYDELLSKSNFFRSHQSHLVNMEYLERYDNRNGDFLHMVDGSEVPISRRKREMLIKIIKEN